MYANNVIYTDISFDPQTKKAVLKYSNNDVITTTIISDTKNTEAELKCIIWTIESLLFHPRANYILYTDCKTAVDLQSKPRYNKHIYNELLTMFANNPHIKLIHLQGHKKNSIKSEDDIKFSTLDKAVRQVLRADKK